MGIGFRIKEAREKLGLTQIELGKKIGVTGSAITNYEKGISHPKEEILYKLFSALECDANYLFQDEMKKTSDTEYVSEAEIQKTMTDVLVKFGWMEPDGDLTEDQLLFLQKVIDMLDVYFSATRKKDKD